MSGICIKIICGNKDYVSAAETKLAHRLMITAPGSVLETFIILFPLLLEILENVHSKNNSKTEAATGTKNYRPLNFKISLENT